MLRPIRWLKGCTLPPSSFTFKIAVNTDSHRVGNLPYPIIERVGDAPARRRDVQSTQAQMKINGHHSFLAATHEFARSLSPVAGDTHLEYL
jgi:hypothetical protein